MGDEKWISVRYIVAVIPEEGDDFYEKDDYDNLDDAIIRRDEMRNRRGSLSGRVGVIKETTEEVEEE